MAIPDEELETLARWGVTGLWLIGLWERSKASERIKRMRGKADAVASAYSLDDYAIAEDLGGEAAYANLRDRAWGHGIRLASDMVPNHMGIDSRWVIEHPEWFLTVDEPPYPVYAFTGPDLSPDPRVGIVLEDHYWDDSDAAVVFQRTDRATGEARYVYHGNDGTSFPWNDTAQLDFLDPAVREQVIQAIIDVARRFPIIRFDAAMVLAKKHIQRLWWPEPGTGGGIPSRAEHALTKAEFDARMPVEFWREVVDRVAAEVPGTLLLAEAFWLLEGYFVRTLGMHRVYNSAFMHMLRDEDTAGYRKTIKETIEFDPEILKRYVNFMSNPDEKTAIEQFGKGDKYFGVATVLATLPGLPMLGHGQIQGFGEKYGMEFRRAMLDEQPDPWLVARHEREIFPLLHKRAWFAEAADFLLYDFATTGGHVDDAVLAYSNGSGRERSLVLYHNRFGSTTGRIHRSSPYAVKSPTGAKRKVRRSLAEGLGLPNDPAAFVAFRDARTGLEYVRSCRELWERGLEISLDAYTAHVFWEFREVFDGVAGQWARLAGRLAGRGVASLDEAMRELQLEPIHGPMRAVFADGLTVAVIDGVATPDQLTDLEGRIAAFLRAIAEATGVTGDAAAIAARIRARTERLFVDEAPSAAGTDRSAEAGDAGRGRDDEHDARRRHAPRAAGRCAITADRAGPGPARPGGAAGLAGPERDGPAGRARQARGDEPGLVRRAPDAGRPGRRPPRRRPRRGCRVGDRRPRSGPARAAAPVDDRGADPHRAGPPAGCVAVGRGGPGGDRSQHLGRRRVRRPRPGRGPPRLGCAPRRHRRRDATGGSRLVCRRGPSVRGRRGRRLSGGPDADGPRRAAGRQARGQADAEADAERRDRRPGA